MTHLLRHLLVSCSILTTVTTWQLYQKKIMSSAKTQSESSRDKIFNVNPNNTFFLGQLYIIYSNTNTSQLIMWLVKHQPLPDSTPKVVVKALKNTDLNYTLYFCGQYFIDSWDVASTKIQTKHVNFPDITTLMRTFSFHSFQQMRGVWNNMWQKSNWTLKLDSVLRSYWLNFAQ